MIMKKFTFILALCCIAFIGKAQVIHDETFDYPVSGLILEPTWTNTLSTNSAAVGTIGNLSADPLSYGDANGLYALSGAGKLVTSDYTSGGNDFKVVKSITPTSSGVIYLSLLCKPGVAQNQSNSEIMGLSIAGSNGPKVLIGKGVTTITDFRFATTRASSSSADYRWSTREFTDISQTFLLVVKYDWAAHTASLFINPVIASASEPTPDVIDNTSAKDVLLVPIDGIRFRTNGSSAARFAVSGVRVSTTWAAAVGKQVAPLASPTASAASSITNSTFVANWTPSANATGYEVAVYASTVLVKTITVAGQSSSSVSVSGLNSNTDYTYKVTAVADKITYANSFPSADSPVVTTAGLSAPTMGVATNITTNGFTANWSSVANASGYDVMVMLNGNLVKTIPVDGQASSSVAIADLQMGTSYSYKVIAKGDINSTPSVAGLCNTEAMAVASITTDFGVAAIWGPPVPSPSTNLPLNGNYPTWKVNGFTLEKALFYAGSSTGPYGESHTNVISFDKLLTASVVFPVVSSVAQIEFHANSGSDAKSIALEELASDNVTWLPVGASPYITNKVEAVYVENISRATPTTFRLRNNATSSMNLSQIIVRSSLPTTTALPSPTDIGAATGIAAGAFTASWTPVANAVGYIVSVSNYGKAINKNYHVEGQSTSSYSIIGLDSASMCTYKVAAVGDGVSYSNSLLSVASASFKLEAGLLGIQTPTIARFVTVAGKTIFASEVGNFEIYNLQGSKIAMALNLNTFNTNLPRGMYVVRFTNGAKSTITRKIVIQ
jgi:hypothetical protein